MTKKIFAVIIASLMVISFFACARDVSEPSGESEQIEVYDEPKKWGPFIVVECDDIHTIMYDPDTGVMYVKISFREGMIFSELYEEDGSLKVYDPSCTNVLLYEVESYTEEFSTNFMSRYTNYDSSIVLVDKSTNVMYMLIVQQRVHSTEHCGRKIELEFIPLKNADGTLKTYAGAE